MLNPDLKGLLSPRRRFSDYSLRIADGFRCQDLIAPRFPDPPAAENLKPKNISIVAVRGSLYLNSSYPGILNYSTYDAIIVGGGHNGLLAAGQSASFRRRDMRRRQPIHR